MGNHIFSENLKMYFNATSCRLLGEFKISTTFHHLKSIHLYLSLLKLWLFGKLHLELLRNFFHHNQVQQRRQLFFSKHP